MPSIYVPIFIFVAVVAVLIPATLLLAKIVRPSNPDKTKLMPYECGVDPIGDSRQRYTVRFYIVAILFVIFDIETVFLVPWAVQYKALGLFGAVATRRMCTWWNRRAWTANPGSSIRCTWAPNGRSWTV